MSTDNSTELELFHRYIGEQLKNGEANLSPEEALDLWRCQHPASEDLKESVAAVTQGLSDIGAGRSKPLEQFLDEFHGTHGTAKNA